MMHIAQVIIFSHAGGVSQGMAMSVTLSTTLVSKVPTTIGWIARKFCTNIHGHQRRNPTDFSDSLTFLLEPPAGQMFPFFSEISQKLKPVPSASTVCSAY